MRGSVGFGNCHGGLIRVKDQAPTPASARSAPITSTISTGPLLRRPARRTHVKLSIYDVTGARAAELIDGILPPGLHTATFESGTLSSGIYFASVETGGKRLTTKVVKVK